MPVHPCNYTLVRPAYSTLFARQHQTLATMSETRYAMHVQRNIVARSCNHRSRPFDKSIQLNEFFFYVVVALFYGLEIKLQKFLHFHRSVTKHIFRNHT